MKQLFTLCILFLFFPGIQTSLMAQSENGYFQVELEEFSPPMRDLIKSFEGFPATPFLANDMTGEEQYLGDFKGKPCVLFFWNTKNAESVSLLYQLNQLKKKLGKKVGIIAMADDSREEVGSFIGSDKMNVIIIPNTRMLSEAVYGVELGYPRVFIIDDSGIIRSVIPEQYFNTHHEHINLIEGAIKSYI